MVALTEALWTGKANPYLECVSVLVREIFLPPSKWKESNATDLSPGPGESPQECVLLKFSVSPCC